MTSKDGRPALVGRNDGQRRIRVAALSLRDSSGRTVKVTDGLAGYVLANSTMRFALPRDVMKLDANSVQVSAQSDLGPINDRLSSSAK